MATPRCCAEASALTCPASPTARDATAQASRAAGGLVCDPQERLEAGRSLRAGGCACGAVRYRVADAFLYASNCHCSRCRASTGSAFKALAGIERDKLELTAGADALFTVGEETQHDTRCRVCGSLLFSVVRDGAYVHVAMGSLVDPPTVRPREHIFVGSKAAWFEITDDLPQYDEYPGSALP